MRCFVVFSLKPAEVFEKKKKQATVDGKVSADADTAKTPSAPGSGQKVRALFLACLPVVVV
jgi:hypothetical protein